MVRLLALLVLVTGCTGSIEEPRRGLGTRLCAEGAAPGRSPIRRLNRDEYANTVRDLLSTQSTVASAFPLDEEKLGFTNNADALAISGLLTQQYMGAAELLAAEAVTHLPTLLPCDPAAAGQDPCAQQFIAEFGGRAFRRPLTEDEKKHLFEVYLEGKKDGFNQGISLIIEAALQSPHFLYRVERGTPSPPNADVAALSSWEMATRLSYFVWGSLPDSALFEAARANALGTAEEVEAQVRRMLGDPRARASVARFHRQWLSFSELPAATKDASAYPQWKPLLISDLNSEISAFVDDVFNTDGRVETLLTAPYTFLNPSLATFYGLPAPSGLGFSKVALPGGKRAGILTQGALMAMLSFQNQTSPIHRGKFVREHLLCQELTPPPPELAAKIKPPDVTAAVSTRERFAQHSKDPACSGCHSLMDPIGVAFEHFDPIGRWRDKEGAFEISDSGNLIHAEGIEGAFEGPVELGAKLSQSKEVHACVVKQWFRYANGRAETDLDACSLKGLQQSFDDAGHDMRALMVKMAVSDAFRFRSTQGGGP
jgi:hypothetical protein